MSSVESVFLGSFTGDSWPAGGTSSLETPAPPSDSSTITIDGFAMDAQERLSEMKIVGTMRNVGFYQIELSGGISPALVWIGYGSFNGSGTSASGTWQIQDDRDRGTWPATRFTPPTLVRIAKESGVWRRHRDLNPG